MRPLNAFAGFCLFVASTMSLSVHAQCTDPDTEAPVITNMPVDISQPAEAGLCGANVSWTIPNVTDNCEVSYFKANHEPDDFYAVGITTVTYTARDVAGNITALSFTITISDNEDPSIADMPEDINLDSDDDACSATATWDSPTADDNCNIGSLTSDHDSGSTFPVGSTVVTYTATDVNGNSVQDSFTVTVTDNTNPTVNTKNIMVQLDGTGLASITPAQVDDGSSDACGIDTYALDITDFNCDDLGEQTVTLTVQDIYGNSASATATVTVQDAETAVIEQLTLGSVPASSGACSATVTWTEPTVSDNCPINGSLSADIASGSSFDVGTTPVTYTYTDNGGNTASMTFNVTVTDEQDPTIDGLSANLTPSAAAGTCGADVSWDEPTALDNCPGATIAQTAGAPSGSNFAVGSHTIFYTATDDAGNMHNESFTITVSDDEAPTIDGLSADLTPSAAAGTCGADVSWDEPTALDNCPGATIAQTAGDPSGSNFTVGSHTITYTATDASGNEHSESFTITVSDDEDPTIDGLSADLTPSAAAGTCGADVTWDEPTAMDNCPGSSIAQTEGDPSGSNFTVGSHTITYTATDASGNEHSESFTITVSDDEAPTIDGLPCAGAFTQVMAKNEHHATNGYGGNFLFIPNADYESLADDIETGDVISISQNGTTVQVQFSHWANQLFYNGLSVRGFYVNPGDFIPAYLNGLLGEALMPGADVVFPCDNLTPSAAAGTCGADVSWDEPTALDNCPESSIAQTEGEPSGSNFTVGSHTITYTATDASGNEHSESFTITVSDDEAPTIDGLSADLTPSAAAGTCGADVSWDEPTALDNCPGATIAQTAGDPSGSNFTVGSHTITYTATDASGNEHSESFTITVSDDEDPTIDGLSADLTPSAAAGTCGVGVAWDEPTAMDNCPGSSIAQTEGASNGSNFAVGSHTITYTATDASGNEHSESFTITVSDDEDPTIDGLSADLTPSAAAGTCGADVTWDEPTAMDNCPGSSIAQTEGDPSGSNFTVGSHTITYTATDASGNEHSESFTITVSDDEAPTIDGLPCAGAFTQVMAKNEHHATNGYGGNFLFIPNADYESLADDIETGDVISISQNGTTVQVQFSHWANQLFYNGLSVRGFYVNPGDFIPAYLNGLLGEALMPGADVVFPCDNLTPSAAAGTCGADVSWDEPTALDNCPESSIAQTEGEPSGSNFTVGSHTITYTATDASGNEHSESFTITVSDDEAPTIDGLSADLTPSAAAGTCGADVSWDEPTALDNCPGATIAQTAGDPSGSNFTVGSHTITYTATDASGNEHSESFTITVSDDEDPTIDGLSANLTPSAAAGTCGADVSWDEPTALDNCPGATIAQTAGDPSGSNFTVGSHTITYTATDASGNEHSESFTITVSDDEDPTIDGLSADLTPSAAAGTCGADVTWDEPTAMDNCPGSSIAQTEGDPSGSNFTVGSHTITYTATDASGNEHSESFTITVSDDEAPTIDGLPCAGAFTQVMAKNEHHATNGYGGNFLFIPNADYESLADDIETGDVISISQNGTTVQVQFSHWANQLSYNGLSVRGFYVNPGDFIPAYLNGLLGEALMPGADVVFPCADMTSSAAAGTCGADVTWDEPTALDNCPGSSIAQTEGEPSGSNFTVGSHTITYTATDASGNEHSESFTITVSDDEAPTIDGLSADLTPSAAAGTCGADVSWDEPTALDNCPGATIAQTAGDPSGSNFTVGSHTITYTATDASGNEHSESFTITVSDDEDPTIDGLSADLTPSAAAGTCGADVTWDEPTAMDNCPGSSIAQTEGDPSGYNFAVGSHTITYTATDASGNEHSESFTITVSDDEYPTISGMPENIELTLDQGTCDSTLTWAEPSALDNCEDPSIALTAGGSNGSAFGVGTHTITYTATDASGNEHSESFFIVIHDNDYDVDGIGDCSDPDVDGDGSPNIGDSNDFNEFICSDDDEDGCDDCSSGTYDVAADGPDSDGDGICDDGDNCSDPLANNYLDPANGECENCPNAPIFDSIYPITPASTMSALDGAIALEVSGNSASTLFLTGVNGAPDYEIDLSSSNLDNLQAGYYMAMIQDDEGCWGVSDTSVGGTTLQQPAICLELIIPFKLCCSGCGINDIDADGVCDDDDNCTDQSAPNFADPANTDCIEP